MVDVLAKLEADTRFLEWHGGDIDNPQFNNANHCHDWRNYVNEDFKRMWPDLTRREKLIIAYFADVQAQQEEWD
jgi:hypothetical protein